MKKLKICLLGNILSIHTIRWVNTWAERGYDVHLITQHRGGSPGSGRIKVHYLPFQDNIGYFINVPFIRKCLNSIKPDLLHTHYASGYGTLGRLSRFHPNILSVWGSDVYDFPYQSHLKMKIIQKNLKSADLVASTSRVMAKHTQKISNGLVKRIYVTPFGIDTSLFQPKSSLKKNEIITIGTVKTLSFKYGIDTLIKGFAETRHILMKAGDPIASRLRLLIVGGGRDKDSLEELAGSLNISEVTEFTGAVAHSSVPDYLNRLDVYVAASRFDSESFGVAILEASACALPVIVTNVGGLPEVVDNGVTGLIIPKDNHHSLAKAIEKLLIDEDLRKKMGKAGQKRVIDNYSWEDSVLIMEDLYKRVLQN